MFEKNPSTYYKFYDDEKLKRGLSKTPRSFTTPMPLNELPAAVSVNVDWLSLNCECSLEEPKQPEKHAVFVNDEYVLEYQGRGTNIFKHSWAIYSGGEQMGMIHTHPRNTQITKAKSAKLEIANNVLYCPSEIMAETKRMMEITKCDFIKNITRLDIAIDGANHVPEFLNQYTRHVQCGGNRIHRMGKASFTARLLDDKVGKYKSFKVGSSRKNIVVYCKSKELELSRKEYIREAWRVAGLDENAEQWRVELRLNSEAIKEIEGGFNLEQIQNPLYLLSYFRSQIKNFFEFRIQKQKDISRCEEIDLFQFQRISVPLLKRIPPRIPSGVYKAQMSIHNAAKNIFNGVLRKKKEVKSAIEHLAKNIEIYNLEKWYMNHLEKWKSLYMQPVFSGGASEKLYKLLC